MKNKNTTVDEKRALAHLMDLLAIEGLSGSETKVAAAIKKKVRAAGVKPSQIRFDDAHERIGEGYEVGNLIVTLPGTRKGPRRLLMGHMDTVPLCRGAIPVRRGNRIVSQGHTGLGADNRTAVACLVTVLENVMTRGLEHPPLTVCFTVGEEVGLHLSECDAGIVFDLFLQRLRELLIRLVRHHCERVGLEAVDTFSILVDADS